MQRQRMRLMATRCVAPIMGRALGVCKGLAHLTRGLFAKPSGTTRMLVGVGGKRLTHPKQNVSGERRYTRSPCLLSTSKLGTQQFRSHTYCVLPTNCKSDADHRGWAYGGQAPLQLQHPAQLPTEGEPGPSTMHAIPSVRGALRRLPGRQHPLYRGRGESSSMDTAPCRCCSRRQPGPPSNTESNLLWCVGQFGLCVKLGNTLILALRL
jgi:hypothetical protein